MQRLQSSSLSSSVSDIYQSFTLVKPCAPVCSLRCALTAPISNAWIRAALWIHDDIIYSLQPKRARPCSSVPALVRVPAIRVVCTPPPPVKVAHVNPKQIDHRTNVPHRLELRQPNRPLTPPALSWYIPARGKTNQTQRCTHVTATWVATDMQGTEMALRERICALPRVLQPAHARTPSPTSPMRNERRYAPSAQPLHRAPHLAVFGQTNFRRRNCAGRSACRNLPIRNRNGAGRNIGYSAGENCGP